MTVFISRKLGFRDWILASGECLKIQVLVLGRHSIEYSELLFVEFYFGDYFKIIRESSKLGKHNIIVVY